jgi:hypothetical protein
VWDYCAGTVVRQLPDKGRNNQLSKKNFLVFLQHKVALEGMKNRQTRMLAGDGPTDDLALLQRAKERLLDSNTIVGCTELFSQSGTLINLGLGLGWDAQIPLQSVREASDKKKVSFNADAELTIEILKLNLLDAHIHAVALKLVASRYDAALAEHSTQ